MTVLLVFIANSSSQLAQELGEKAIINNVKSGNISSKALTPIDVNKANVLSDLSDSQFKAQVKLESNAEGARNLGAGFSSAVDQAGSTGGVEIFETVTNE